MTNHSQSEKGTDANDRSTGQSRVWEAKDRQTTIGMHLTQLQNEDPKCVFIARRVSGMGFQSQDILARHFGEYGKVLQVLVAHSKVKPFRRPGAQSRIRPGSLGFIVMADPQSVERILAVGMEQTVCGCRISVEPFEKIAKPRETATSSAGDSTTTASTNTGSNSNDSTGSGSAGSEGCNSNGSEEGSDKGNGSSGDNCSQPKGSYEDSAGGDSQSDSSNRNESPTVSRPAKPPKQL